MNKLEQAARQALEALETLDCGDSYKTHNAATALRKALTEQAEQEPVVKYYGEKLVKGSKVFALLDRDLAPDTLLYAAPVRTKDLTDDEIAGIHGCPPAEWVIHFARAVIAADRSKNGII